MNNMDIDIIINDFNKILDLQNIKDSKTIDILNNLYYYDNIDLIEDYILNMYTEGNESEKNFINKLIKPKIKSSVKFMNIYIKLLELDNKQSEIENILYDNIRNKDFDNHDLLSYGLTGYIFDNNNDNNYIIDKKFKLNEYRTYYITILNKYVEYLKINNIDKLKQKLFDIFKTHINAFQRLQHNELKISDIENNIISFELIYDEVKKVRDEYNLMKKNINCDKSELKNYITKLEKVLYPKQEKSLILEVMIKVLNYLVSEIIKFDNMESKCSLLEIIEPQFVKTNYMINILPNIKDVEEYYLNKLINTNDSNELNNIGTKLFNIKYLIDIGRNYKIKAIKDNNVDAIISYSDFLIKNDKNYNDAKMYIKNAFKINSNINNKILIELYEKILEYEKNIDELSEFYLMLIENNNIYALDKYSGLRKNKFIQYNELSKINNTNIHKYYLKQLNKDPDIFVYNNKKKFNFVIKTCDICYKENTCNIILKCHAHFVCDECYIELYNKRCPFCRFIDY